MAIIKADCGHNYSDHLPKCPRCGTARKSYTTDGKQIIEKPAVKSSDWEKNQAKLKRKIPSTDDRAGEGFITSTLPGGKR